MTGRVVPGEHENGFSGPDMAAEQVPRVLIWLLCPFTPKADAHPSTRKPRAPGTPGREWVPKAQPNLRTSRDDVSILWGHFLGETLSSDMEARRKAQNFTADSRGLDTDDTDRKTKNLLPQRTQRNTLEDSPFAGPGSCLPLVNTDDTDSKENTGEGAGATLATLTSRTSHSSPRRDRAFGKSRISAGVLASSAMRRSRPMAARCGPEP